MVAPCNISTHTHARLSQGADTPLVDEVFLLKAVHKTLQTPHHHSKQE